MLFPSMIWAVTNNLTITVSNYIKDGIDVNERHNKIFKETYLIIASWRGHIEIVKLLINAGADMRIADSSGYTALIHAERNNHTTVYNYLKFHQRLRG